MSPYPKTIKGPNHYIYLPPIQQTKTLPTIIFFITGNPGLIKYYHVFLDLLHLSGHNDTKLPKQTSEQTPSISKNCVIAGFSLGGFEIHDSATRARLANGSSTHEQDEVSGEHASFLVDDVVWPSTFQRKDLYDLRDQIELCYARLCALTAQVRTEYATTAATTPGNGPVNVIMIGHSVGAYIVLETIRLHHTRLTSTSSVITDTSLSRSNTSSNVSLSIRSCILLTPTILHISHSPSGQIATPLLSTLPFLPSILQLNSRVLTTLLPQQQLHWLVARVTGMSRDSDALDATVQFLCSSGGVRQALSLARCEMREIGGDEWGEEVWGVLEEAENVVKERGGQLDGQRREQGSLAPKLYFWFAREDHWVAEGTRKEILDIVEVKGRKRAEVVVDEDEGLVHAWCIGQNDIVARRVRGWVEDILIKCA